MKGLNDLSNDTNVFKNNNRTYDQISIFKFIDPYESTRVKSVLG